VLESKQFQAAKAAASQLELAAQEAGVIEKKKSSQPVRGSGAWDDAMVKARGQAADVGEILETLCAMGKARRGPPSAKTAAGQAKAEGTFLP
jgi:hypothetical protein